MNFNDEKRDDAKEDWEFMKKLLKEWGLGTSQQTYPLKHPIKFSRKQNLSLKDGSSHILKNSFAWMQLPDNSWGLVKFDHQEKHSATIDSHYGAKYRGSGSTKLAKQITLENGQKYILTKNKLANMEALQSFTANSEKESTIGKISTKALSLLKHNAQKDNSKLYAVSKDQGQNIKKYLETVNPDINERLQLAISLCHAVNDFHRMGFVHFDIKPENIAIKDGKCNLIDFGSASKIEYYDDSKSKELSLEDYMMQYDTGITALYTAKIGLSGDTEYTGKIHDMFSTLRTLYRLDQSQNEFGIFKGVYAGLPQNLRELILVEKDADIVKLKSIDLSKVAFECLRALASIKLADNSKDVFDNFLQEVVNDYKQSNKSPELTDKTIEALTDFIVTNSDKAFSYQDLKNYCDEYLRSFEVEESNNNSFRR